MFIGVDLNFDNFFKLFFLHRKLQFLKLRFLKVWLVILGGTILHFHSTRVLKLKIEGDSQNSKFSVVLSSLITGVCKNWYHLIFQIFVANE